MNRFACFCILLAALVFASPLLAMAGGTITGRVTDRNDDPLHGATVLVQETGQGTATDADGHFVLTGLESCHRTLIIRYIGYREKEFSTNLPGEVDMPLRIVLSEEIIYGNELLVVGNLFERMTRYQPTRSYRAVDIQQRNTSSIGTLLDGEPGVAMRSMGHAPARPVIRGMDGERIQVLQNGMRMGDLSSTGHDHAVILDPSAIDRVDIVRGPASLIYGSSAMGGIINVHSTDIPTEWSNGFSGTLGAEGQTGTESAAGLTRMTYGTDKQVYTFRSSLRNTGNMQTPAGEIPDTGLRSLNLAAGTAWRYGGDFTGGSAQYTDMVYGIPDDPFDDEEKIELAMQRLAIQGMSSHRLDHRIWEAVEARLTYNYYSHEEIEYEYVDGVLDDQELEMAVDQHQVQTDLLFQHGQWGRLDNGNAGITLNYRDITVGGEETLTPDARGWNIAGYVIEEIELPRRWRLQGGLRLEWNRIRSIANEDFPQSDDLRSQGIWAGSIGICGPVNRHLETGLQFSRAHRTPSLEELFADAIHFAAGAYEVGDPQLDNEVGYGLDYFLDAKSESWEWHLALFANRFTHYIALRPTGQYEPDRGYPIFEYFGTEAQLFGGEFTLSRILTDHWKTTVQADYIHGSERRNRFRHPLPFMPPLRVTGSSGYDAGMWWTRLQIRHVFPQNRTAAGEEKTDGYTLTDLSAGLRLDSENLHHLTLTGENLLNVTWRDHLSRIEQRDIPMTGRNIRLSYRYYF